MAIAAGGCGASSTPGLALSPSAPGPKSPLRFTFTAPDSSGRDGGLQKGYTLGVSGPARHGCAGLRADQLPAIAKGARVNVTVAPPRGGLWCTGRFTAQVQELARPVCDVGSPCPQFIRVLAKVGQVRFRISN